MKPRICVPLPIQKISELHKMIRRAQDAGADFIEVRLDYLQEDILDQMDVLKKEIAEASVPLIATNREHNQGGKKVQEEKKRVEVLIKTAEIGFDYVDIELSTLDLKQTINRIANYGSKPIISYHSFKDTPSEVEMEKILKSQIEAGASVCKLVTTANTLDDSIRCLFFTYKMSKVTDIVCFAMGKIGFISRVLSPIFGALFTFSSLEQGLETAPGQIPILELKDFYRKLGVDL
ncbi:type I 3-dehydroquinate dehydratase [Candidatus Bathyarchaeota archaeon]|nr:type I 3-dehydroquinate dehydratase [Candidatus Bathyarchaeota archaeon]